MKQSLRTMPIAVYRRLSDDEVFLWLPFYRTPDYSPEKIEVVSKDGVEMTLDRSALRFIPPSVGGATIYDGSPGEYEVNGNYPRYRNSDGYTVKYKLGSILNRRLGGQFYHDVPELMEMITDDGTPVVVFRRWVSQIDGISFFDKWMGKLLDIVRR